MVIPYQQLYQYAANGAQVCEPPGPRQLQRRVETAVEDEELAALVQGGPCLSEGPGRVGGTDSSRSRKSKTGSSKAVRPQACRHPAKSNEDTA